MRKLYLLLLACITMLAANAQLTGTKSIPGDYATITAAVNAVNTQGVGAGGVVFNIAGGFTETITAPVSLTATGTAANPIIFQKSGAGANPQIMAYVGTGTPGSATQDGIWRLVGSDYVTIDGINLLDTNTVNPGTMEYGYSLYKASLSDGCQFVTIKNCTISLSRNNNAAGSGPAVEGSKGIEVTNATPAAPTTSLTPTTAAGTNSNNKFYSNTIQNCNYGIVLSGFAASSPFTAGDTNNDIGGTAVSTGNTILNYGGAAAASNPAAGIRANNQWGVNISYNTINNNNGSGANHATTLRGIYGQAGTSANANINNNTITVNCAATTSTVSAIENVIGSTASSNTININNNIIQNCTYSTATSGVFNAILSGSTAATVNINGNTISGNIIPGTGDFHGIYNSTTPTNLFINNNQITGNQKTGASGALYCVRVGTAVATVSGNTINNNSIPATSGTSSATLNGIYSLLSPTGEIFTNNIITNLTIGGSSTSTAHTIMGIQTNSVAASAKMLNGNTIAGLIINAAGGSGIVRGIQTTTGATTSIAKNKIYNLSAEGSASVVSALQIVSGVTVNVFNNLIGDLRTPSASAANPLVGINIISTATSTNINVYYNTIFLNSSSTGANFGSSGIFHATSTTATTAALTLRNNIIINTSTASGTGLTAVSRRSSNALNNYSASSDNNLFYAGTPGPSNVIFNDGTNTDMMLDQYQTRVAPRDKSSVSESVNFLSVTGSAATYLHIDPSVSSRAESGANPIAAVQDDFDGQPRQGSPGYTGTGVNPDMGADEFEGINNNLPATDITVNALTAPAISNCYTTAEAVKVQVRNTGTATLNFATTPLTVSVAVTGAATANLSGTLNTGTLTKGASTEVTMTGTLNMSAPGTYTFRATSSLTGDANPSNDTFAVAPVITKAPGVSPIASGAWNNPATWCGGVLPTCTDSVSIPNNITVTVSAAGAAARVITVVTGGTLSITGGDLTTGCSTNNNPVVVNGSLSVTGGTFNVNGYLLIANGANFEQTAGAIVIDGNDGTTAGSVGIANDLFGIGTSGTNYASGTMNVTGGTITIVDPHYAGTATSSGGAALAFRAASGAGRSFGNGHTVIFGGTSGTNSSTAAFEFFADCYVNSAKLLLGNVTINGNGANRRVQTNAVSGGGGLDVSGNLLITAGSELLDLTTAGQGVSLAGNLTNNGIFTQVNTTGLRLITFSGTSNTTTAPVTTPQTIDGSGTFRNLATAPTANLATLLINNTSTAGITLNVPLQVSGTLNLTAGRVNNTPANVLTLGISAGTRGTFSRTSGYVAGTFKRWFGTVTTALTNVNSIMPVGFDTAYRPAHIVYTTAPTTGGTLTATFIAQPGGVNGLPLDDAGYLVDKTSPAGFWRITKGDGLDGGTYDLTLKAYGFGGITNAATLRVVKRVDAAAPWTLQGTHVLGNVDTVRRSGMSDFSDFGVGAGADNSLPVTLEYFNGHKTSSGNALAWKVNCTSTSVKFSIERSSNGREFSSIGGLEATRARCGQPFDFSDNKPGAGINYYRIKMTDPDGTISYTNVVAINGKNRGVEIVSLQPTLVNSEAVLYVAAASAGKLELVISDMTGKRIQTQTISVVEGENKLPLHLGALAAGVYHLSGFTADGKTSVIRFVKQ